MSSDSPPVNPARLPLAGVKARPGLQQLATEAIREIRRKLNGAFDRVADTAPFRSNGTNSDFRKVVKQSFFISRLRGSRERLEQAQIDQSLRAIYQSGIHTRIATR